MSKRTLTVTVDGQTFSRLTAKDYTHAIMARRVNESAFPYDLIDVAWCGSAALAEKQVQHYRNIWSGYASVEVAQVDA